MKPYVWYVVLGVAAFAAWPLPVWRYGLVMICILVVHLWSARAVQRGVRSRSMNKEEAEALVEELEDAAKEYKDALLNDFPEGNWRASASKTLDEVRERVISALVRGGD